jgi:hypothetical protein
MGLLGLLAAFWFAPPVPTFSHDVAPLLYRRCVSCHHAGGVAPFALVTFADTAKRASLIAQVTAKHYMPPWLPAEPAFQHELKLSGAEISWPGGPMAARPKAIRAKLPNCRCSPKAGAWASPISKPACPPPSPFPPKVPTFISAS